MDFGSVLSALKGKPAKKDISDNEIGPRELMNAGVEIKRGDPRLKKGITKGDLTADELKKLEEYRSQAGS